MHAADIRLLLKKVAVSVVVAAIPLVILVGGLWLTRILLDQRHNHTVFVPSHSNS